MDHAQTGAKRETVEQPQPACDTVGEGDPLSRGKITSWNPPRAAIQKIDRREAGTRKRTEKSVTGQPSDGTRISGKTIEIERRFCPNGHGGRNMHVAPQQNPFWACEPCQNNLNLGLDGRVVRLIDRVDLENLDALMTPIGNDDETRVFRAPRPRSSKNLTVPH